MKTDYTFEVQDSKTRKVLDTAVLRLTPAEVAGRIAEIVANYKACGQDVKVLVDFSK